VEIDLKKINCSVLILAQNSEAHIQRCLDSLKRFKEVVVIDGGSTDKTKEFCFMYENVKFIENPWPGFIEQRNFSISKASFDWCFMIDSDEAATDELVDEIGLIVTENRDQFAIYNIMRTEYFLGEKIRGKFGGSEWQLRLFIRNRIKYTGGVHHEHLIDGEPESKASNKISSLDSKYRILHDNLYGLEEWTKKLPRFALLRAEEKLEKNPKKKVYAFDVFLTFIGTFFKTYSKSMPDKRIGVIIAFKTAINRTLAKLIMYEHQNIGFHKSIKNRHRHLG
jgi:glycosyltransferase involved in cell wall biosynthesis